MRGLWRGILIAVALVLGLGVQAAEAQIPTPSPSLYAPDYGSVITNSTLLGQSLAPSTSRGGGRRGEGGGRGEDRDPATRAELRRLRYRPRRAVTRSLWPTLFPKLVEGMDASCCAGTIAEVRERLETGAYLESFEGNIRALRAKRNNLGDALGVGVVMMHLAYHLEPGDGLGVSRRGAHRFIATIRERLATQPRLRRLSDADKQRRAERMAIVAQSVVDYQASWTIEIEREPERAAVLEPYLEHNRDLIEELLDKRLDFDVEAYRLTKRGFVRR